MRVNSFFSGIGGFELGFEAAGFETKFQCEIDNFCETVLTRRWPGVPRAKDIRDIDSMGLPTAEVWAGGFPCQDLSVARAYRERQGLAGEQSGLFFEFLALIRDRRPRFVVLENVLGLLSSQSGRDFFVVLDALVAEGYGVAWRVLNTQYFGAPQSRPRVFLVAAAGGVAEAASALYERQPAPQPPSPRQGFLRATHVEKAGATVAETAYCLAATSGRHTGTDWSRTYVSYGDRVRRLTPSECERLQGFPIGWTDVLGGDDADSPRYKALGNAVSVPVAAWIARNIRSILEDGTQLVGHPLDLQGAPAQSLSALVGGEKWARGGIVDGDSVVQTKVSPAPVGPIKSTLSEVIETGHVEDAYFISPNAAAGILRRVESQGRTLFEPLHESLKVLALAHG